MGTSMTPQKTLYEPETYLLSALDKKSSYDIRGAATHLQMALPASFHSLMVRASSYTNSVVSEGPKPPYVVLICAVWFLSGARMKHRLVYTNIGSKLSSAKSGSLHNTNLGQSARKQFKFKFEFKVKWADQDQV
jgi:hypothetical protein